MRDKQGIGVLTIGVELGSVLNMLHTCAASLCMKPCKRRVLQRVDLQRMNVSIGAAV